mgnify:FL=1
MAEKELIPNDTPEIAKLKACKTYAELADAHNEILYSKEYKHYSESYKEELKNIYKNILTTLLF